MPNLYGPRLTRAVDKNEQKTCDTPGCYSGRYMLSRYCVKHWRNNSHWGHPQGFLLKRSLYLPEYHRVSEVIDSNRETHKGIQQAFTRINAFLSLCEHDQKNYPREMYHFACYNLPDVEALILKEASALHLHRAFRGNFKSDKHFDFITGHRVLRLVPLERYSNNSGRTYSRQIRPKSRKLMGEFIRFKIGVLLVNITKHIMSEYEREEEIKREMCQPLN